jgi:hypothetical protein
MIGMSRAPATPDVSRPHLLDYLLILAGSSLSLLLAHLAPIKVQANDSVTGVLMRDLVEAQGQVLCLSDGIVLLWPFFYLSSRLTSRYPSLTAGEWLWILAWLGVALLTAMLLWKRWASGSMPELLLPHTEKIRLIWYLIFVPTLGALALIFAVAGLMAGRGRPWTHSLALALVLWPVAPLALILSLGKFA